MSNQIGSPTLFFTLSAKGTKWPDLHKLFMKNNTPSTLSNKKCIDNVITNPHTTSLYLHQ